MKHLVLVTGIVSALLLWFAIGKPDPRERVLAPPVAEETSASANASGSASTGETKSAVERRLSHASVSLSFEDFDSGEPVNDVLLRWRCIDGERALHSGASERGAHALPQRGEYVLACEAPGYVPLVARARFDAPTVLRLERESAVRVVASTSGAEPTPPLARVLLPPVDGRSASGRVILGAEASRRVDDVLASTEPTLDGLPQPDTVALRQPALDARRCDGSGAEWTALVAADGYRWELLGPFEVELVPAHELPRVSVHEDGRVEHHTSRPERRSGTFGLARGQMREWTIDLARLGALYGALPETQDDPIVDSRVVIRTRRVHARRGIGDHVFSNLVSARTRADECGRFAFEGVAAGTKRVLARWRTESGLVSYAMLQVELEDGEARDLGYLEPRDHGLDLRVAYVDETGAEVDPWEVLEEVPRSVTISLVAGKVDPYWSRVVDRIAVPVGGVQRVRGLAAGHYQLDIADPGRAWRGTRAPWSIDSSASSPVSLDLPSIGEHVVEIPVWRPCPLGIVAQVDGVEDPVPSRGLIVDRASGRFHRLSFSDFGAHGWRSAAALAPGRYDGQFAFATASGQALYWSGEIEVPSSEPQELRVEPEPAASITGRLLDRDGQPLAEHVFTCRSSEWATVGSDANLYLVRTDEQGRFRIDGVEPGATLVSDHLAGTLTAGEAPAATSVGDRYRL